MMYYTYLHRRASDNLPFYVGKGHGDRAHQRYSRSKHWSSIVEKHGLKTELVAHWPTEQEALDHEKFLILCFRDMGFELCNKTDGGDGVSGHRHNAEIRRQIGNASSARARKEITKYRSSLSQPNQRRVLCVEANACFVSMSMAASWLRDIGWSKASVQNIQASCAKKIGIAYGHHWEYI